MKKIYYSLFLLTSLLVVSCGEVPESATTENESDAVVSEEKESATKTKDGCIYVLDAKATKISWKAFKTNDKVAVGGIFPSFEINGAKEGGSIKEILESAKFSIPVSTLETGDKERDKTLLNYFFNLFVPEGSVFGAVDKVDGNNEEGIVTFILKMNGGKLPVDMNYVVKENTIIINGVVDLETFHGQKAMESLNEQCGELHKGKDGVSKLWPDVEVEIMSKFKVNCD